MFPLKYDDHDDCGKKAVIKGIEMYAKGNDNKVFVDKELAHEKFYEHVDYCEMGFGPSPLNYLDATDLLRKTIFLVEYYDVLGVPVVISAGIERKAKTDDLFKFLLDHSRKFKHPAMESFYEWKGLLTYVWEYDYMHVLSITGTITDLRAS